jgi:transposase
VSPEATVTDLHEEMDYWRTRADHAEVCLARAETELAKVNTKLVEANTKLVEADAKIAKLTELVSTLGRILFGKSTERGHRKGDVPDPEGELDDEGDTDSAGGAGSSAGDGSSGDAGQQKAAGSGEPANPRGQQRGSRGHGRRDYSNLKTLEIIHEVPVEDRFCPCCGVEFEAFDAEYSEQIDWEILLTRVVHIRKRYRRRCSCPGKRTVTAPPPPNAIPKGLLAVGFLARLLFFKYSLGMPLHRIARSLAAEGLVMSEGTLCGALCNLVRLVKPLYEAICAHNAEAVHTHIDETSWRVYEQDERAKSDRWWLWTFLTADTVVFKIDPTRSTKVLEEHFGISRDDAALADGRRLLISSDFYAAYQCISRIDGVDPLWCFAHVRRRFIRAGDSHRLLRAWSDDWVELFRVLYAAHGELAAAEVGTAGYTTALVKFDEALSKIDAVRQRQTRNIDLMRPAARKALENLNREWEGLAAHRDFPDLPLDNNPAERALRTPVINRKNSYGSHAKWAANLAAMAWTITATAERNHREPLAYLIDYLNACAISRGEPPKGAALDRFLPWIPDPDNPTGSRDHNPHGVVQPDPREPDDLRHPAGRSP